ncbi:MAG: NAD(P)H-binding protein [Solirubrobacterales bacterium]
MILLTGATGSTGSRLLDRLLDADEEVRCQVREPRRLGRHRVDVQITMGDLRELSDPYLLRQAMRGVDTVIHLAASLRDQSPHRVEELNGLATVRLVQAAEQAGVKRFVYFSALNATPVQRTRFFRSKWAGEQAVRGSSLESLIFRPSIVFDQSDPWVSLMRRFSFLPVMPVSGDGRSEYQPIWADDAAAAVMAALEKGEPGNWDLAGPETMTYSEMSALVARAAGRPRPLWHVPLPLVHLGLSTLYRIFGETVFATWQEAEVLQIPMTTPEGTTDIETLGVTPSSMTEVLSPAP